MTNLGVTNLAKCCPLTARTVVLHFIAVPVNIVVRIMTKKMREWLKKHYQDKYEPHDAYEVENKYPKIL